MPSGNLMNTSTCISGCRNAASTSHILATHHSYLWYKVSPIRILVDVYDATGENDSVPSTPGTCMYPLTTLLNFIQINTSGYSLLLNTHLTSTKSLPFAFTMLLLIGIHSFLDRKWFTSKITDIFHKCPFGLVIAYLKVSGSPASVEIDVLHVHCISSYSCSTTIRTTLVSPVNLYFLRWLARAFLE